MDRTDLTSLPPADRETEARRLAVAEASRPFDLERGPLVRAGLLILGQGNHIFLQTMHRIVVDGCSEDFLNRELVTLYHGFAAREKAILPELPLPYSDFADWQRRHLDTAKSRAHRAYWRKVLEAAPAVLELPTDRPRLAVRTARGARLTGVLGEGLVPRLEELGRRQGANLVLTLLAGFQVLLGRYSGQEDVVVGCPIAGRTRRELEGLVGPIDDILPIRADLSGSPTFRQLLARVRDRALMAKAHQELPIAELLAELRPIGSPGQRSFSQVLFQLRDVSGSTAWPADLDAVPFDVDPVVFPLDLSVDLSQMAGSISCKVDYSTDLFDPATIERFAGHFRTLLDEIADGPERCILDLPLQTSAERRRLLLDWNDTDAEYPHDRCLHQLFEDQAARSPDALALVCGDRSLTYHELNARANRLGHHLRSLGVGPEVLVGLFAERSPEMVIGLLGILKAGGAYLPLEPDYPEERLALMLDDARPAVVLTQEHLAGQLPDRGIPVLCLDRDWYAVAAHGDANLDSGVGTRNLAYLLYTSGSTGRPKGVMISHASSCNDLLWAQDVYGLTAEDRVLQKTPFSFDTSVWEFFGPLLVGARVVLARPGGHREPSYLAGLIRDAGITIIHFVPSMLQVFLEEPDLERSCRTLRHVFAAGEALAEPVARRCLERLSARLHNLYGPTEAGVVTYWECRKDDPPGPVPIGRPIANTKVYVLDPRLQPVPVGVAGELFLEGIGVARGYLNRPELTAERFLPDPFDDRPEARLYRTGDLFRWRADGNLEFLGRLDHQVKLRGFRIELGEIEAALAQHPAIRQAVVLLREDRPGDRRLVAYTVAANDGGGADDGELRAFLSRSLPDHMVPSAFVPLAALPLNSNGKLDRKALPAPQSSRSEGGPTYVAPRGPVEEMLATIWEEVLGWDRLGIHDNFFHLGGHSLLATRATARASDRLGIEIPPRALFDHPTIAGLAEQIARWRVGGLGVWLPITRQADGPLPLSFAQQRLWFLDCLEGRLAAYNTPTVTGLRGELDVEALRRALEAIVARHEPLRTTFPLQDGMPSQRIHSRLGSSSRSRISAMSSRTAASRS